MTLFVCAVCQQRIRPPSQPLGDPAILPARECPDCDNYVCPRCGGHQIYQIIGGIVMVPPQHAASVRASVWGRGH